MKEPTSEMLKRSVLESPASLLEWQQQQNKVKMFSDCEITVCGELNTKPLQFFLCIIKKSKQIVTSPEFKMLLMSSRNSSTTIYVEGK